MTENPQLRNFMHYLVLIKTVVSMIMAGGIHVKVISYVSTSGFEGFPRLMSCFSPLMLITGVSVLVCHTYT